MKINRFWGVVSAIVFAAILVATLTPVDGGPTMGFWCVWCGAYPALDMAANVIMFLPFGIALVMATNRRWMSVGICVATTVTVELLQIRVIAGRDASFSDILSNSLGGLIGAELAIRRVLLLRPTARIAQRFALAWSIVFAAVCAVTAAALRPAAVPASLSVQWTPERSGFQPFSGKLLGFQLDHFVLPLGYPSKSLGVDQILHGPRWETTTTISTEGLEPRRSVIARIAEEFTILVSVEQLGWDLGCEEKTRSSDFRFRSPKVALRNAFLLANREAPSVMTLTCGRFDGTLVTGTEGKREVLRLSPSLGWMLLSPFDVALNSSTAWVSAVWLIALAFPAGYWIASTADGSASRRRMGLTIVAFMVALALGLAVAPTMTGTSLASPGEWASTLCGGVLGAATAMVIRRVWTVSSIDSRVTT